MRYFLYIFSFGIALSCSEDRTKSAVQLAKVEKESTPIFDSALSKNIASDNPSVLNVDSLVDKELDITSKLVKLKFNNVEFAVDLEEVWNDDNYFKMVYSDTIFVELGLASKPYGHLHTISKLDSSIHKVEILQRYETSLTLMNEGPHIDLVNWKHYYNDWEDLKIENRRFVTSEYSEEDWQKFPTVTTEEIVQAIRERFDGENNQWVELAQKCQEANHYPCGVAISKIYLRVILTDNEGIKSEKIVVYQIPMGC